MCTGGCTGLVNDVKEVRSEKGEVLLSLTCRECDKLRYACSRCGVFIRGAKNKYQVLRHMRDSCPDRSSPTLEEQQGQQEEDAGGARLREHQGQGEDDAGGADDADNNDERNLQMFDLEKHLRDHFPKEAAEYYLNEINQSGSGLRHMASKAILSSTLGEIFGKKLTDYHTMCMKLAASLSKEQLSLATSVIENTMLLLRDSDYQALVPLLSVTKTRRYYLEGSNAMLKQAPTPRIADRDEEGFVHVNVEDCVNILLAEGKELVTLHWSQVSDWKDGLGKWHSPWHQETYERIEKMHPPEDLRVHVYYLWSDGFQKNVLLNGKKTDLQVFTAYFVPPEDCRDLKTYTKPLAIGTKNKEHQGSLEKILVQCLRLGLIKERWCGKENRLVHAIFVRRVIQNDLIERWNNTQTMAKGAYHRRWGWATEFTSQIPSCNKCRDMRFNRVIGDDNQFEKFEGHCKECGDWWANNDNCSFPKPKNYPHNKDANSPEAPIGRDILALGEELLPPVQLSFDFLIKAFRFAVHNHLVKKWNQDNLDAYLRTCCFHGGLIKAIKEAVSEAREKGSSAAKIEPSPVWVRSNELALDFSQIVDTPMHMMFLGITKHLMKNIERLFAGNKKVFKEFSNAIGTQISMLESESLSWCRGFALSNNDSIDANVGWQSTHFVAFARLSLVYFGYLEDVDELENMEGFTALKQMWVLFYCLLSYLFGDGDGDGDGDAEKVGDYARLFLSACISYGERTTKEALTGKPGAKKSKAKECFFEDTSNYFCLPNLEDLVRRHKHMRNLWEGEREKYIKFLKAFIHSIQDTDTYFAHVLRNMLRSHFIDDMMEDNSLYNPTTYDRTREYRVYTSFATFKSDYWDMGAVLTAVSVKDHNGIFICLHDEVGTVRLLPCDFADEFGTMKLNLWYSVLVIDLESPTTKMTKKELGENITDTYIIHPMVTRGEYKKMNGHTVIGRSWNVRGKDGKFHKLLPSIEDVFRKFLQII